MKITNQQKNLLLIVLLVAGIFLLTNLDKTPFFSLILPPSDGLVSHWDFEGGRTTDRSSSNHGENFGTFSTSGIMGDAVQLDGTSFIEVSNSQSLNIENELMISTWININQISESIIVDKSNTNDGYSLKMLNTGSIQFCTTSNRIYTCASIPRLSGLTGQWLNIIGIHKNGINHIYLNGFLVDMNRGNLGTTDVTLLMGQSFIGKMDEVAIFNKALTNDEIKSYIEDVLGGPVTPLLPVLEIPGEKICFSIENGQCNKRTIPEGDSCGLGEFGDGADCILALILKVSEEPEIPDPEPQNQNMIFFIVIAVVLVLFVRMKR